MQQAYPAPGGYHNANSSSSPASTAATGTAIINKTTQLNGGRFDFDDGGSYCGGWEDGKAHGHGVCTGPKGQGAYCGSWHYGFEVSGVYTWPSGSTYEGQWQNGKRHGLGVENRGRWIYRGEWTQGFKGRYGVRQSNTSNAKYEGTWANGLQDGYGSETYADGGTYQGQWLRGMRHGYGVRTSARFDVASRYRPKQGLRGSLTSLRSNEVAGARNTNAGVEAAIATAERDRRIDDSRGGFVLKARSDEPPQRRRSLVEKSLKKSILKGLKIKQRSTGDLEKRVTSGGSIRSTASSTSWMSTESSHSGPNGESFHTDSNASFVVEDEHPDANVTETYRGEWKNDKRSGYGISERTDGLRYEGEWFNNKKYGYGVTIHRDGTREEGKYKNNVLITSQKKKHIFLIRSAKFRERIDAAVNAAQRASKIAMQKEDIAISRMATARGRAEMADTCAYQARDDSEIAKLTAKQFAPDFSQPAVEKNNEYKSNWEEKLGKQYFSGSLDAAHSTGNNPQNQNINSNPPLPPRGQTPQPFQHRQSLSQFQPRSVYAQKDLSGMLAASRSDSVGHSQLPVGQTSTASSHNYRSTTPVHEPYKNSNLMHNQNPTQTEPMHSQMQPGYRGQPPHYSNQQTQQHELYLQTNARLSRGVSIDHSSSSPQSHPLHHQTSNSQFQQQARYPSMNSSQSPYMNSVNLSRDSVNGYRPSVDYGQHQQDNKSAYANRMNATADLNEPYQRNNAALQRNSKLVSGESPYSFKQAMNDHFDHYTRPPSRDSSVDRYTRAASRLSGNSRQPSVDRIKPLVEQVPGGGDQHSRTTVSAMRGSTPVSAAGNGLVSGPGIVGPVMNRVALGPSVVAQPPFEDFILRKRSIGQEIVPSPIGQPKRTESLYIAPSSKKESQNKNTSLVAQIQRKKSMPDFQGLPTAATPGMSREEVSVLSSARREEMRRLQEENERLRANPLLYLVSPQVREWFSRQQLVMLVLFVNISLAIVFFKLLTS